MRSDLFFEIFFIIALILTKGTDTDRRILLILLVPPLCSVVVMSAYTQMVYRNYGEWSSHTEQLDVAGAPFLTASFSLWAPSVLYQQRTEHVFYNFSIQGLGSPLNITIEYVQLLLSQSPQYLDENVGVDWVEIVARNTTRFSMESAMDITVSTTQGDAWLGGGVELRLQSVAPADNVTLSEGLGTPKMVAVSVLPAYLWPEGWTLLAIPALVLLIALLAYGVLKWLDIID